MSGPSSRRRHPVRGMVSGGRGAVTAASCHLTREGNWAAGGRKAVRPAFGGELNFVGWEQPIGCGGVAVMRCILCRRRMARC